MRVDVLPRYVRDGYPIAVRIAVENQTRLVLLHSAAKELASKIQTEFERHVEPRQVGPAAEPHGRNVVNSVGTQSYDARDLVESDFAGVIDLKRTTGYETEIMNDEDDSLKNGPVRIVERAIDEYVFAAKAGPHALFARKAGSNDGGHRLFNRPGPQIAFTRGPQH